MLRDYSLDTCVVFVDLVKAFDTVNHELLVAVLERMGLPTSLLQVFRHLYHDFNMNIKVGDVKSLVYYVTGVKQGDNLAPTLFLFMMQEMHETTTAEFTEAGIFPVYFLH